MKNNITYRFLGFLLISSVSNSCINSIDFETENFESALVIEATLTNEMKQQVVFLSRTYLFEEDGPSPESNAIVNVIDSNGVTHIFEEEEDGRYVSAFVFSAQPNIEYQLKISTNDGKSYITDAQQLTQITQIDQLNAERTTSDTGVEGMAIYVDSFDPSGNSKYYRYEYEETFKIIAPFFRPFDLIVLSDIYPFCNVGLVPRPLDKAICYSSDLSTDINVTTTVAYTEDRVTQHLLEFLSIENYKITHRYSILAKQYVQTREAHAYYKALKEFTSEGSIFSQNQPGFVSGNIISESNASEKVIGFFEVSSVSSKRVFFNFRDYFEGYPDPPYAVSCVQSAPRLFGISHSYACGPLINTVRNYDALYLKTNEGEFERGGPYILVPRACGDCTALGSNVPPDFWID